MTLRLESHWMWDFWFARDGDDVHVFYLQAPRSLGDPDLRHRNATIGHAVSTDLRRWRVLPDALGSGPAGDFDDMATWTGSVLGHDGRWHMFYSGISHAEDGEVQRIGLATSDDLVRWERHGVLLEADPRWYERESWRDPWVDRDGDGFQMLICARAREGPADERGVIGQARSRDLRHWEIGPPLSEPGEFRQLEVPQRLHVGGAWRILFCAMQHDHGAARRERAGFVAHCGTHYLTAGDKQGPYALDRDDFLVGDPDLGRHYAGRMIRHGGAWQFLAWRMHGPDGVFLGELSDPMPVRADADGSLSVQVPQL
jgi:beta-fructofuranosidase